MNKCLVCETEFKHITRGNRQIYCNKKCSCKAYSRRKRGFQVKTQTCSCVVCGKSFKQKRINNTKYCSGYCKRLGVARAHKGLCIYGPPKKRQGLGYITYQGYKMVSANHPNAKSRSTKTGKGQILEHVLIMSNYLGRPLNKNETVHHKNGIRNDNRPENLELWSVSHPFGQRINDKIKWCIDFLKEYGYEVNKR